MKFVNLTPHTVQVGTNKFPPSGAVARATETTTKGGTLLAPYIEGRAGSLIHLVETKWGAVEGLPEPAQETLFIVSNLVMGQTPRRDLVAPADLVRDDHGRVIGCRALRSQPGGIEVERLPRPEYACPACGGDRWEPCPTGGWWCEQCC